MTAQADERIQETAPPLKLAPRRGGYWEATALMERFPVPDGSVALLADLDLIYRTLCAILFNFAPLSGHPGGSISSGRIVAGLLFHGMDYLLDDPEHPAADVLSYAAGHKALGLYAMWALRNECARISRPDRLPGEALQLRLEDLLGFRKNPTQETPLFLEWRAKALDGHPTPQTPFVKLATGASGVGVPASFGLALGALDTYGDAAPTVHVLEAEGGMTAGRVSEALATAATAQLWNVRLHVDWNQSSIDSDRVCREDDAPGDYVQWSPAELCVLHDWNVIAVADGRDLRQVLAAQAFARTRVNDQPAAIVYRTVKGWQYGIEGRKSHGAGHEFCSPAYHAAVAPMESRFGMTFPQHDGQATPAAVERTFYESLQVIRGVLESNRAIADGIAARVVEAGDRLKARARAPRPDRPRLEVLYSDRACAEAIPPELDYAPGARLPLRAALGDVLGHLNRLTNGAFFGAAADLLDSTSLSGLAKGFPKGLYRAVANPGARLIATGGICEDCMGAFMSGLAAYGQHIGVGSSYAAFIAALQHIPARLHGIGQQARRATLGEPYRTFVVVCAHAGLKTGEDGATHADPQALQLVQENFPAGTLISLTPWEPAEMWPLTVAALQKRPAVLVPFVTRPIETVPDRVQARLPVATESAKGVYAFRTADRAARPYHGTLVLQGSEVASAFVAEALPRFDAEGLNMNVVYVSSAELFALLPEDEQDRIFPEALAAEAMGITGFTLPTLYRWVTSRRGRAHSLHAFSMGRYPGSGQAHKVLEEAGLHAEGQWRAIVNYARSVESAAQSPRADAARPSSK